MNFLAGLNTPLDEPRWASPEAWRHDGPPNWMKQAVPSAPAFRVPPMEADYPEQGGNTPWLDPMMMGELQGLGWNETTGTPVESLPAEEFLSLQDVRRLQSPVSNHNLQRQGATAGANRIRW
jgi:hypothetical protein